MKIIFHKLKSSTVYINFPGYPSNTAEADQLVRLGFYPSGAIILNCSREEATKRLLPEQLKKWREKEKKKQNFNVS